MVFLAKYIRKYGKPFSLALLFVSCEALCDLLQPALISRVIDEGVANRDMGAVLRLGGWMLLVTAAGAVFASGRNIVASHVSQRFSAELRGDLFRKIQTLSFSNLDRFDKASLVTRLTNDVTQVQNFANGMMRIFAKAPILGIGSLIMAVRLSPSLSWVFAVVVPVVGLLIAVNLKVGFPLFAKVQGALDRLNGMMREYLAGVRVVKAFNRFGYESEKFGGVNADYRRKSETALRTMAVFNPLIALTVNFGIVAVIWLGGVGVGEGGMQVGHIVAFVNYMTQILFSLMMISMVFAMFVRAKASASRIGEVLAESNPMKWREGKRPKDGMGKVEFDGVSFHYGENDGEPVLKNVSLACSPGETVGIIGSTGAGKTTLVHLIPRFYDSAEGAVRLGGVDVKELDPGLIREKVAIVPQRTVLFSGTILDNIRFGNDKASMEEVEAAARIAQAHDFIVGTPDGYRTRLGQGGVNLSGGQKQRISIARALVRKPDILILDDCTSALDAATEERLKEALRAYSKSIACFVIAQRIASVMDADRIVVLENGEIAGIGTHAGLLAQNRIYREIYRSQIDKEMDAHASGE
ncbi:ABC transporter ATP-binding protein [Cohnella massiliensis]|uniref:ABC transporter ATP-binding protein n=1 Tax=Cohnella massiliensis TaxID=1816691 RepID=UPI0009BA5C07|nr:ABC transporter ATP-binding protein [Cohnella massiliensis]